MYLSIVVGDNDTFLRLLKVLDNLIGFVKVDIFDAKQSNNSPIFLSFFK